MSSGPAVLGLGNGQVLIRGAAVVDCWRALGQSVDVARRRDGMVPPARVLQLAAVLEVEAAAVMARSGLVDVPPSVSLAGLGADVLTTSEVARMTGLSARQTRRRAAEFGGRLVAGRLVFDPAAVLAASAA